ncbi:MAG TPA: hypothetical protein VEK79_18665, partial [Thermoanaerobaculia bacterium]|nr:hypothetical protein [Thermoanaerobaculia bacterium]
RTNLGIVANGDAIADVVVYDAAGNEVATLLYVTDAGVRHAPLFLPVSGGRARVRFRGNPGQAYASLVDGRTGDATYIVYSSPRNDR